MPVSASVFALPDRLAAKRDPALIGADLEHFAAIERVLTRSIADLTARRAVELRDNARDGQAALDRDQEVRRLNSRLSLLARYGRDLTLGRMIATDGSAIYVGRLGLTDSTGERLLIDWRSPAAAPFFGATRAEPMGLASRRRYRWTAGRITDYWDEAFTAEVESTAALDDESAFIASLGTSRSSQMRDVLGTIQADQDAIIRADSAGALVVDGGPGTGKTVVALHRTAYLLYSDARLSRGHGGVLFVGPSAAYLDYVDDVLPSLGEEGVQIATLRDLVPEAIEAVESGADAIRLKSSARLLDAVDAAVARYETPPTRDFVVETEWGRLLLSADDWADAFDAREPGTPHNEAREQVWEELLEILGSRIDPEAVPPHLVRRQLAQHRELRAAFARTWPVLDPQGVVADLWSVPAYLALCAPWLTQGDIHALQRADARAWTPADLPFLDAAHQLIGDRDAARRAQRRKAVLAAQSEEMERVIDNLIASEELGDGDGNLRMLSGDDIRARLVDESEAEADDLDGLAGPFAHIVVDEAQELTDAEWRMLTRRVPSRSFTIVGDRAQARRGFPESWQERLSRIGLDRVNVATLTVNYRTPEEVMAEAEPVIRAALPDANVPTSIRSTGIPVRHAKVGQLDAVLTEWLAAHPQGIAAVIGGEPFDPPARVRWLRPEQSKGLEFDLVVLVDPQAFGDGTQGAVDRYVAMTRATQTLVVLTA